MRNLKILGLCQKCTLEHPFKKNTCPQYMIQIIYNLLFKIRVSSCKEMARGSFCLPSLPHRQIYTYTHTHKYTHTHIHTHTNRHTYTLSLLVKWVPVKCICNTTFKGGGRTPSIRYLYLFKANRDNIVVVIPRASFQCSWIRGGVRRIEFTQW